MKQKIFAIALVSGLLSSCVTMEKYSALQSKNDQLNKQYSISQDELAAMTAENKRLLEQNKQAKATMRQDENKIADLENQLAQK